jgi:hypothetical protein
LRFAPLRHGDTNMPSAKRTEPSIELYMYSLNQEFPVGKGHHSYLKRAAELQKDLAGDLVEHAAVESQIYATSKRVALGAVPADWSAQWVSNEWITNHTAAAGIYRAESEAIQTAVLREEDFGAIVFDPRSDRVYKLNQEGSALFKEIRALTSRGGAFSVRAIEPFSKEQVGQFAATLQTVGLLSRK